MGLSPGQVSNALQQFFENERTIGALPTFSASHAHLNDGIDRLALGLRLERRALSVVDLGKVSTSSGEGTDVAPLSRVPSATENDRDMIVTAKVMTITWHVRGKPGSMYGYRRACVI